MTSIEWLIEKLKVGFMLDAWEHFEELEQQAKEKHKEEIIDAHIEGQRVFDKYDHTQWTTDQAQQYYQETFVSKGSDETLMERKLLKSGFVDVVPKKENHISDISKMVEDDVEKLALDWNNGEMPMHYHKREGFKVGYNKAKETLYTEEQVREVVRNCFKSNSLGFLITEDDIMRTIKQPKQ
jgi:hypothetical protein